MHTVEFARTWFLPLGLLVVTACSSNGTSALWRIDDVEFGEGCASGGILLHAGEDTDRDGVLSDSEITSTTPVCDGVASASGETGPAGQDGDTGETGATGETGDADCLTGGLSIQVGLENGDGDATERDGELYPDEIDDSTTASRRVATLCLRMEETQTVSTGWPANPDRSRPTAIRRQTVAAGPWR
jgi:hypothetical protein